VRSCQSLSIFIWLLMPAIALAQTAPMEEREEDDEPNQQDVFESLGA